MPIPKKGDKLSIEQLLSLLETVSVSGCFINEEPGVEDGEYEYTADSPKDLVDHLNPLVVGSCIRLWLEINLNAKRLGTFVYIVLDKQRNSYLVNIVTSS